jgi:dolichol-phosphate mannosyltransferase
MGMFGFSVLLSAYYLVGYARYGTPMAGFTTLVVLTLFFHSITFIFLGVLGEYLSRIFDDSKNRPRVIIAEATTTEKYPTVV